MTPSSDSIALAQEQEGEMPRNPVLGVGITMVSLATAADIILGWVAQRRPAFVTVTGVHGVMEAQDDPALKAVLNASDLCVPDGMPLVWLGRLAGHRTVTRVFGPDLMLLVTQRLAEQQGVAFYYGGPPGVAESLAQAMETRFPGIVTAGTHCPPFRDLTDEEGEAVVEAINRARPDILWIGISTPKQEKWMARFRPRLEVPVIVGVGAAFDYNSGRLKRAPRWMQNAGLEWLYRLLQEPRRLWRRYLRNNPRFVFFVVCQKLGLRRFD